MRSKHWVAAGLGVGAVGGFLGGLLAGSPRSRVPGPLSPRPDGPAIPVRVSDPGWGGSGDRPASGDSYGPATKNRRDRRGESGRTASSTRETAAQENTGSRSIPVGTSSSGGRYNR